MVYRFKLGIYIPQHVCGIVLTVIFFLQVSAVSVSATASVEPSDFRRAVSSPNLHCTISAPSSLPDDQAPLVTGSDVCLVSFGCCVPVCVCVCVRGVGVSVHVGRRVVVSLSLASVHISVCLCHCVNVVLFSLQFSASSVPPATSVRSLDLRSPAAVPPDEHAPLVIGSDVCLVSLVCVCVYKVVSRGGWKRSHDRSRGSGL